MSYSVNKLTTVADCDSVLEIAAKEKADLEFRKTSLQRRQQSYSERSVALEADLAAVTAELGSVTTILGNLPAGDTKDDMEKRKRKLEYRKFTLEDRSKDFGAIALLEKEMEVAQVQKQIDEIDAFVSAVTTHKATL